MPQQRQLAAIMFTDIAGFTFLMGKDERRGMAVLEANRTIHRSCIEAHHGHLVKEIGDGTLSSFSSAVNAVQCALAVQQCVKEHDYRLRIGIHLGDVVLSEGDVYGNTVNIANRVESVANPGAVFVTEQVVESIRGIDGMQFAFLGEKSLKNVEPAVRIFGLEHPDLAEPELKIFLEDSISKDIQHYQLVEKLGVGGMGIIYKALDTSLERFVALKFLNSQLSQDEKSRKRFLQEARAAAALQHPGICTIYEIDKTEEGRFYIAMELVEGLTFSEYLEKEGPLPPERCLDLALQLAEGIQHAHQAGIVHRDIKPENIKITPENNLKILDFGLAFFGDLKMTKFGLRVGTLAYMSPEQARGDEIDQRTDIWSFGVVLYKMLTGRLPFTGEQEYELVQAIVHNPPAPIAPGVPAGLAELTGWCLEKEVYLRIQTMRDLIAALERLKRDLSRQSASSAPRPFSSRQLTKRLIARPWLAPLIFFLTLALGWVLGVLLRPAPDPVQTPVSATPAKMTPFTVLGGLSFNPTWSPDGEWVAYVSNETGNMDIWKKPASGGKAEQLTDSSDNETEPAWSPDGRSIVFRSDGQRGGLFVIPAGSGTPFQLTDFGSSPAWSPDSRRIAFAAYGNVYLVSTTGEKPWVLVEGTSANPHPVWTADGKRIIFWHRTLGDVHVVDAEGGDSRPLSLIPAGQEVSSLSINQRGDRLLFSMGAFGGNKDLYEVPIDPLSSEKRSAPRHLTVTPTDDIDGAYAPDGRHIIFAARLIERHLYRLPFDPARGLAAGEPRQLTRNGKMNYYPELSPDGKHMMWTSHLSGQGNLYSGPLIDGPVEKVTAEWDPELREIGGRFDPGGQEIYFTSTQGGSYQLWRLPSIGSVGIQLTETRHPDRDVHPTVSPDGASLVFYSNRSGTWDIWQLKLDNGNTPKPLTDWPGNELYPTWSPDGRAIAFVTNRDGNADIWKMTAQGADARPLISNPAEDLWCAWSPDQRWLFFVSDRDGNYNIWRIPGEGGIAEAITAFNDPAFGLAENSIFTKFAVGADQLILSLESRKGDIFMLEIAEE